MKIEKRINTFKRPFDLLVMFFKQRFCSHVFRGPDMGHRNEQGVLAWPCSKCGKVYEFEYGLQAQDHGQILGPWGT
jgi:hypothetical protein